MSDTTDRLRQRRIGEATAAVFLERQEFEAMLDVIDAAEHAAGFAARGQGSTPVLTQQIVAELDAALARFREVSG